jgi:hypothetical protein
MAFSPSLGLATASVEALTMGTVVSGVPRDVIETACDELDMIEIKPRFLPQFASR